MSENALLPVVPTTGRSLTDLERAARQRPRTFGNQLRRFAGPHLTQGVNNLAGLLHSFGPQADVQDMIQFSQSSGDAAMRGDVAGAVRDFGYTGAALAGLAWPGSASTYKKAGEEVSERVIGLADEPRKDYVQGFLESAYAGAGIAAEGTSQ